MNRIALLEADLRRGDLLRRRRPAARGALPLATPAPPRPAPGAAASSVARAMSVWAGTASYAPSPRAGRPGASVRGVRRGTRAMSGPRLDFRVPNLPNPLQQPLSMSCWATVGTMMTSWRDQATHTVEGFLTGLGGPWLTKFQQNSGLYSSEMRTYLATMGMQNEPAQVNYSAQAWEGLLRQFGPLWVTADNDAAHAVQGIHEHMLVGIHGPADGDPDVDVIDPGSGRMESMPLSRFVARYEQLAGTDWAGLQVRHWPAAAQRAAQQSLAWARQASVRLAQAHIAPAAVAAVAAAAGLGWEIFKEVVSENNSLTWTRSRMQGVRLPREDASKESLRQGQYRAASVRSRKTLAYDFVVATDHVGAEFEVQYRYNGHCVGEVTITNTSYAPPGPLSGRRVSVDTTIAGALEHETADMSAVQVEIVYSFSNVAGSEGTWVHRFVLFGDGRAPRETMTRR